MKLFTLNLIRRDPGSLHSRIVFSHMLCWALFITYELFLVYLNIGKLDPPYIYVIYYAINISYFYGYLALLNHLFSFPKRNYLIGLISIIGLFMTYLIIKFGIDYLLLDQTHPINNPFIYIQGSFTRNFGRGLYFTALATFYWSAGRISSFRKQSLVAEKQRLTVEKEKAELETSLERAKSAYLKQQLNPHMLFNTLNFVYNTVQVHSTNAAHCIWLLSEIMRFSLEENGPDGKIFLNSEIEQIRNLVAINQYRFNQPLYLDVHIDQPTADFRIIPLILLTLAENVFKHANLLDKTNPASLEIIVSSEGLLQFRSRNLKKSKNESNQREGLGLKNIRIRLDAAYAENYILRISETPDHYELFLSLNLCA